MGDCDGVEKCKIHLLVGGHRMHMAARNKSEIFIVWQILCHTVYIQKRAHSYGCCDCCIERTFGWMDNGRGFSKIMKPDLILLFL